MDISAKKVKSSVTGAEKGQWPRKNNLARAPNSASMSTAAKMPEEYQSLFLEILPPGRLFRYWPYSQVE